MDERDIESHPDLMNPDWQKHAEREAWIGARRDRRRGKRRKTAAIAAAVVVVLAAVVAYLWTRPPADSTASPVPPGPSATTSLATAPAPSDLPDEASVDLTKPFEGTPAQNWREGIDGLTVPPAAKVGAFSAKQVDDAQQQVKQAIVLAHFDKGVLENHNATAFVRLFAPNERADLQAHAATYVIFLADGNHLLPVSPRMSGTMTTRPGKDHELVMHVSYVVAYAFDPDGRTYHGPADLEPFVRVDQDYVLRVGAGWEERDRGLWLGEGGSYYTSIACGKLKEELLAPALAEANYDPPPLSKEPGQFDPAKPLPVNGNCTP